MPFKKLRRRFPVIVDNVGIYIGNHLGLGVSGISLNSLEVASGEF
jgi:hypothetical protein